MNESRYDGGTAILQFTGLNPLNGNTYCSTCPAFTMTSRSLFKWIIPCASNTLFPIRYALATCRHCTSDKLAQTQTPRRRHTKTFRQTRKIKEKKNQSKERNLIILWFKSWEGLCRVASQRFNISRFPLLTNRHPITFHLLNWLLLPVDFAVHGRKSINKYENFAMRGESKKMKKKKKKEKRIVWNCLFWKRESLGKSTSWRWNRRSCRDFVDCWLLPGHSWKVTFFNPFTWIWTSSNWQPIFNWTIPSAAANIIIPKHSSLLNQVNWNRVILSNLLRF